MRIASIFRSGVCVPLLAVALLFTTGCEGLFDINNPGELLDEDLDDPEMISVLVTGLSTDVSDFVDELTFNVARVTDELAGSGSYTATGLYRRGIIDPDEDEDEWEQLHEARWMSEIHLERIRELLGDDFQGDRRVARSYVFMGVANRALGENYCEVTYDGGPVVQRDSAFSRAIPAFNEALEHAGSHPEIEEAAHGGLAQAYVGLGDWDAVVQHAAEVDTDFEFVAYYDDNDDDNYVWNETHGRPESSAFQTLAGSFDPADVRAPYTICGEYDENGDVVATGDCGTVLQGADGATPHWRQEKYSDVGDDIPIIKGTEMRLLEAEAALRNGDLGTFTAKINEVRDFYDLDPIDEPTAVGTLEYPNEFDDAWSILDRERHLTLWLEGRRLWDMHRWEHPFLEGGSVVYESEAIRASCYPVPTVECRVNENVPCS